MPTLLDPSHLRRYSELVRLLIKYGRSDLVQQAGLSDLSEPEAVTSDDPPPEAEELAADLERLGPTYIKLGQLLSTRADLIPVPYTKALARLQDDVEPLAYDVVERVFTDEIGTDPRTAFEWFDQEPLASASLGQVHRARTRSGRDVVVKVQRPDIRQRIAEDMAALSDIAHLLDRHTDIGRRMGFADLLEQFERTLQDELDYRREAANLLRLQEIVRPYDRLVVPSPLEDLTTGKVLTMEFVSGRKVTSLGPLARIDIDGRALAEQLFRAYLDQILVAGFFHADPHPGNLSLTDDGRLALLDLGMVARVPPRLQDSLVRLLIAVASGRGEEAAQVTIGIGTVLGDFEQERFIRGAAALVERNEGTSVDELDAGALVMELCRLSAETGLRMPPELALLGKALLNLDQVARALDPDFDPSATLQDHAESVMQARMRPNRERLFSAALEARELVEEMPARLNRVMDALASGSFAVKVDAFDEKEMLRGLQQIANRVTAGLLLAALIIGAAMLMRVETDARLFGYPALAIVCFLLAATGAVVLFVAMATGDRRSRRRLSE